MSLIKVEVLGIERKREYMASDPIFQIKLNEVLEHFDIQGNITGIAHDGDTKYGVYLSGKPTVSPIDLTGIETDPLANDLVSVKIDLADNSIRAKVYYMNNINDIILTNGIPVSGTGVYIGEDTFTVYYPTNGETHYDTTIDSMLNSGFSATTFYADGTSSDESVYTQVDAE